MFVAAGLDSSDVRDAVAVQAALLAGGALRKDLMMRVARHRPAVAQRYLALELGRVAERLDYALPGPTVRRIKSTVLQQVSERSEESLDRALSREAIPPPPEWVGVLRPSRLRRVGEADLRASATSGDLMRLGQLAEDDPQDDEDETDETDESKIVNLLSAPNIPNPLGDAIQKLLGMGRSGRNKNEGFAEIPVAKQRFGPVGPNAKRGTLSRLLSAVLEPVPVVGTRYPEWDCHKGAYRHDWCAVAEYDPADIESAPDQDAARLFLQRPLARVGIEPQRHRRQPEGDSLDMAALLDYEADRRHGDNPDPYVYESSRLTKRELSVLVLLDCSGSTAEDSGGRVIFEEERRLAGDLTIALEPGWATGSGHTGSTHAARTRCGSCGSRVSTQGLRHGRRAGWSVGSNVRVHPNRRRDPPCHACAGIAGVGKEHGATGQWRWMPTTTVMKIADARADARQAIKEAVLQGIGVAGIGIRSSTEPEVLEDVWSEASFRVIGQCGDIQRHLRGLLLNALSVTRSNGRRRELLSEEHHGYLRSLHAARRSAMNTYV